MLSVVKGDSEIKQAMHVASSSGKHKGEIKISHRKV